MRREVRERRAREGVHGAVEQREEEVEVLHLVRKEREEEELLVVRPSAAPGAANFRKSYDILEILGISEHLKNS